MKPTTPTLLTLLTLLTQTTTATTLPSSPPSQSHPDLNPSTATPTPSSSPQDNNWWQPIPPSLQDFIAQFNSPHEGEGGAKAGAEAESEANRKGKGNPDLRKRQHGIGGAAPEATTTIATQLSPITTYFVNGSPVVFTQTFAPTPDPWAGPVNGQIGLGSIQGVVGTVRSDS